MRVTVAFTSGGCVFLTQVLKTSKRELRGKVVGKHCSPKYSCKLNFLHSNVTMKQTDVQRPD